MTYSPPALGDVIELHPHDLSLDGGSLARHGSFVVFLDAGLPGQRLRAKITTLKSAFARAEVLEVLAPAKHAAPLYCPHQGICGGCSWPGLDYAEELAWKERQVRESFRRLGRLEKLADSLCKPVIPSPRPIAYRNKLEFAFAPDAENGVALGLKRRRTRQIVPVGDCALSGFPLANILAATRRWAAENALSAWNGDKGLLRHLVVRQPDYAPGGAPQCQVELIVNAAAHDPVMDRVRAFASSLRQSAPEITSFILSQRLQRSGLAYGERILFADGCENIHERIGELALEAPPAAFFQANTQAAALMYAELRRLAEPLMRPESTLIWDLYCGVGGIGLFLADRARRVCGFESSRCAAAGARRNAARNNLRNCAFISGDAAAQARQAARIEGVPDIIITDPPRAGLSPAMTSLLLELRAKTIIAVSCDPAGHARDVCRLSSGYRVRHIQAFDFFPRTPHVETVVLLERR